MRDNETCQRNINPTQGANGVEVMNTYISFPALSKH